MTENEQALFDALTSCVAMAREIHKYWDADNDSKVGKHLMALSGYMRGYRAEYDKIHEVLTKYGRS